MGRNLVSIIARRCADGAVAVAVYVGAGVAVVLLPLLGYGAGTHRPVAGRLGLLGLAVLFAAALVFESRLITSVWPQLLRGARPW